VRPRCSTARAHWTCAVMVNALAPDLGYHKQDRRRSLLPSKKESSEKKERLLLLRAAVLAARPRESYIGLWISIE
jgi:hypothetical protein